MDSAESATAAVAAGAGRLELCGDLSVGGVTPPPELLEACGARWGVPVAVMIRPRGGDFRYSADERRHMARDAARAAANGAAALVTGGLLDDGTLDVGVLAAVQDAAPDVPVVCHKAFDRAANVLDAFEQLLACGVTRVLTSAGAPSAWEGRDTLAALVTRGMGRCAVLPGGRVRADHAAALVRHTGVGELHADGRDASTIRALVTVRYFAP